MSIRLTRAEYWLLETAVDVDARIPLCFLNPRYYKVHSSMEVMFNKADHGQSYHELVSTLDEMFHDGLIVAERDGARTHLSRAQIEQALDEENPRSNPDCTDFCVTPHGGRVWEQFAQPQWDRLIAEEFDNDEPTCVVTGMTEWRVEQYVRYLGMLSYEIDSQSIRKRSIGAWQAKSWKQLPYGHCIKFRWISELNDHVDELHQLAFGAQCDVRDRWYGWR
ncbi:MAG: hypothetical protein SGJ19_13260 [Planctomycetia bacterium]|nr:hypothetical protein [Planctomycetia bacterium]